MDHTAVILAILELLAGIGVFLVACTTMSTNLEAASSGKLKRLFARAEGSRLLGVGIGALGTAAIQSSGATTVMVIGFVNAGVLTLRQAATVIYGANIGTTITGQIVALGMMGKSEISTTALFSALAGVGVFCALFARRPEVKRVGNILTGFGMLFIGLSMMSGSMDAFAQQGAVMQTLARIDHSLVLVLLGAVMTAIIQSSSVMTSIAITMVSSGLIALDQGIFLTMGSNIGSCVVAILAGFSSGVNARRTALIHLLFNTYGTAVFLLAAGVMKLVTGGAVSMGSIFSALFPAAPQLQLAMFHTAFNLITVALVLPLTELLVGAAERLVPEEQTGKDDSAPRLFYLDENMLKTPAVAVGQLKREIENMADIAMSNFSRAMDMICTLDYTEIERFRRNEEELNYLNRELVHYIVQLSDKTLNRRDRQYVASTFRTVSDLERIGDYAENIVEYADSLAAANEHFSPAAIAETGELKRLVETLYSHVKSAYHRPDLSELHLADETEEQVDSITARMADNHLKRLTEGKCTPNVGAQYLELASDAERVGDHLINVANAAKKML